MFYFNIAGYEIPNEFQNPGKFNIGITAGVETDVVSAEFLMGCNKMNLIIVPSNFTAESFKRCHYDKNQEVDGEQQKVGQVKLERPIEVLFEGVDTDVYKPLNSSEIKSDFTDELNNNHVTFNNFSNTIFNNFYDSTNIRCNNRQFIIMGFYNGHAIPFPHRWHNKYVSICIILM